LKALLCGLWGSRLRRRGGERFLEKKDSSFSEEKEARRLLFLVLFDVACQAID
jgi:hypothetical protein